MSDDKYTIRVGMFTVLAIILVIWGWGWLHSFSPFHPPQRFTVRFHDIAGLANNAPVNINGVRVGTVETIKLVKHKEGDKMATDVEVGLKIKSEDVKIPHGADFTIQTLGMVGAKYVEITLPEKATDDTDVIRPEEIVVGEDPTRIEVVINKIASSASGIDFGKVEHQFSADLERVAKAADGIQAVSEKIGKVADNAQGAAKNADAFFARGKDSWGKLENTSSHINAATDEIKTAAHRINKVLTPQLSSDFKETIQKAKETSENIKAAVDELNTTVGDNGKRQDILTMLSRVDSSTANIAKSVEGVQRLANNGELRADVKSTLSDAKSAMSSLNNAMSTGDFKGDIKETAAKVQSAADKLDIVSDQLSQILGKKAPLFHMMFGTPGRLSSKDAKRMKELNTHGVKLKTPPPSTQPQGAPTPGTEQSK